MPVYIVTAPTNPPTEKLVDAPNAASARNHVARQLLSVTVAKGPDLFRIAKAGGDMETVGAEQAIEAASQAMPSSGTDSDADNVDQAQPDQPTETKGNAPDGQLPKRAAK